MFDRVLNTLQKPTQSQQWRLLRYVWNSFTVDKKIKREIIEAVHLEKKLYQKSLSQKLALHSIEKALHHRCFQVSFPKFFGVATLWNIWNFLSSLWSFWCFSLIFAAYRAKIVPKNLLCIKPLNGIRTNWNVFILQWCLVSLVKKELIKSFICLKKLLLKKNRISSKLKCFLLVIFLTNYYLIKAFSNK